MPGPAITPLPVQVLDDSGNPVAGAQIDAYEAGTTTRLATYTTSALATANPNPIIADAAGRFTAYLLNQSYRFDYKTSAGVAIRTVDHYVPNSTSGGTNTNITGTAGATLAAGDCVYLSDGSGSLTAGRWYLADADLDYAGADLILGFATEAISASATGTISRHGIVTGLSGLTAGDRYYVSGTAGGITATAPTIARQVGWADSTTSLVIAFAPEQGAVLTDHIAIEVFN